MTVSDVFELLELDEDDDDEFTNKLLGEWAYEQFDNIPSVGDSFEYDTLPSPCRKCAIIEYCG